MKHIYLFIFFMNILFSQNNYPIVLIHGFFGWGNDEMGNYRYWVVIKIYKKCMKKIGFTVFNCFLLVQYHRTGIEQLKFIIS